MNLRSKSVLSGLIIAFLLVEAALVFFVDKPVSIYLREVDINHHMLINFFRYYTDLGLSKWYLIVSAIATLICVVLSRLHFQRKKIRTHIIYWGERFLFLFVAVAISGLITDCLKWIIGRARPLLLEQQDIYGFGPFVFAGSHWKSMPSGHTTTAFTLAFVLCLFFPKHRKLWLAIGFMLALSRVMVNAHYVADVLAGFAVALVTVELLRTILLRDGQCFLFRQFLLFKNKK